jgi:hypothetical protein
MEFGSGRKSLCGNVLIHSTSRIGGILSESHFSQFEEVAGEVLFWIKV